MMSNLSKWMRVRRLCRSREDRDALISITSIIIITIVGPASEGEARRGQDEGKNEVWTVG